MTATQIFLVVWALFIMGAHTYIKYKFNKVTKRKKRHDFFKKAKATILHT